MKFTRIATVSAIMLLAPVIFSACTTTGENTKETETPVPSQEKPEKDEPAEAVEVKAPEVQEEKAAEPAQTEPAAQPAEQNAQQTPAPTMEQAPKQEPAPAAKAEKKTTPPCDHVVRTGDNLWKLAREYYGEGSKWKLIYEANKAELKNENFLEPGKVLKIPAAK